MRSTILPRTTRVHGSTATGASVGFDIVISVRVVYYKNVRVSSCDLYSLTLLTKFMTPSRCWMMIKKPGKQHQLLLEKMEPCKEASWSVGPFSLQHT